MKKTGILPDYISVDGAEGGTGAAPLEFTNYIGTPGLDGLNFVRNCLVGFGLRDKIKILSSGKITTGFHILRLKALGADIIYAARAMMLSLGCIQALRCHSNACPSGVATQNPSLVKGLVVSNKRKRVKNFHKHTVESVLQIAQAMGLKSLNEITPQHLQRRISNSHSKNYGEIYELIPENSLLKKSSIPQSFQEDFDKASSESFHPLKIS
jgi:glutamate synthase domain-containing protein 2